MPVVQYIEYTFHEPATPLARSDYDKIKSMGAEDFREYISAHTSTLWAEFRETHSVLIKMVSWGLLGGVGLALIFERIASLLFLVGVLGAFIGFGAACSLGMSALSHLRYISSFKKFFRKERNIILLTESYDGYVTKHE
jgi:hypothetical protein